MPIPTCPIPTLDEYRQHCLGFFEQRGLHAKTLHALIAPMAMQEFQLWHEKMALAYYEALYPVVREMAQHAPLVGMPGQVQDYQAVLNGVFAGVLEELPCVAAKREEVGDGESNRYADRNYLERKIDEYWQGIADCEALLALLAV